MLSVHTNNASNIAQNSISNNNNLMTNAMERLSTGLRINSASDDAAGLQIATRLNANVTGMEQASRNVNDASSMLQTADGALEELTNIAMRQKELVTQGSNGVNSSSDLAAIADEYNQLNAETARILDDTEYSGQSLFTALETGVKFQIGAGAGEELTVSLNAITSLADIATGGTFGSAQIRAVDDFIDAVGAERSTLGANINRLSHTSANLANVTENTKEAAGRIMDADFAVESANMTKNQLLVQAGTTVLSNANQNTGLVMGLL
ncbi:flagellin [Shewanella sp. 4_MG-2023]|uniref:flagellin N-terminal helical domain-containing protein n=1 Tax=Shewanella sp. 4_MG-2023 TaxID=3062652 RepID=UPI0026E3A2B1|nr:flagellin [Shewanella sp. 4_MG-2023]MDO6679636.1 flagellin [Shewanella sp. 4_MG-2023]